MLENLTPRFIQGLKNYDLTFEELRECRYYGGDRGRHLNYYENTLGQTFEVPKQDNCMCGHHISEQCYIINKTGDIYVLGNCCIKKFLIRSGRTCGICGDPHQNRKDNNCNECRLKIEKKSMRGRPCEFCGDPHKNRKNNICDECRMTVCNICEKPTLAATTNNFYAFCYSCNHGKIV